ncbi:MAG: hypothetical protein ACJ790_16715 [Myxococcaceae bacterium]
MSLALKPPPPLRGANCPPPVDLEALAAGEQNATVSKHVDGCETCTAYVASLKAESDAFVKSRPASLFLGQVEKRAEKSASRSWRPLGIAALFAAAAAIAMVVLPETPKPGVTFRGTVTVHVKRGTEEHAAAADETLHPEDALRFTLRSEKPGYAVVLERDASGSVTVVAPFNATSPQRIGEGSTDLQDSAILDDTMGEERFTAVFSEKAFDVAKVKEQLQSGVQDPDCDGCRSQKLSFQKTR